MVQERERKESLENDREQSREVRSITQGRAGLCGQPGQFIRGKRGKEGVCEHKPSLEGDRCDGEDLQSFLRNARSEVIHGD